MFGFPGDLNPMSNHSSQYKDARRMANPAGLGKGSGRSLRINSTKLALLLTHLAILVKGNIHYCEPHPATVLELIEKYHHITIGYRWYFQCMHDLEIIGFMRRNRRWENLDTGEIHSKSSLWWFTLRGCKYLVSKSIRGSKDLLKSMLAWLHMGDDRSPRAKDIADPESFTDPATAIKRIKDLINKIG